MSGTKYLETVWVILSNQAGKYRDYDVLESYAQVRDVDGSSWKDAEARTS